MRFFTFTYLVVLIVHLAAGVLGWEETLFITKPMLLSILLLYVLTYVLRFRAGVFGYVVCAALFFSLLGDVFLMFQQWDNTYFILGLSAFLLAHVLYTYAFTRTYIANHEIALLKKYGWVMVAVVGYGFYFFNLIKDHLHDMIGPVMVYTMAIIVMLLIALNRFKKVNDRSFWYTAVGAILFVASDSILAWNKFVNELDYSHVSIMLTYGLAQLGIALGATEQIADNAMLSDKNLDSYIST